MTSCLIRTFPGTLHTHGYQTGDVLSEPKRKKERKRPKPFLGSLLELLTSKVSGLYPGIDRHDMRRPHLGMQGSLYNYKSLLTIAAAGECKVSSNNYVGRKFESTLEISSKR